LLRAREGTSGHAALLDQRDAVLGRIAEQSGITVEYRARGMVDVRLGDSSGPYLVQGVSAAPLTAASQPDGTLAFTLGGAPVTLGSGALAGQAQALSAQRDARAALDALAVQLMTQVNGAQANGVTPTGATGTPFFSGTRASDLAVVLADGAGLATAPAGAGAQSRSTANLDALRAALSTGGPTSAADALLTRLSQAVAGREVTHDVLATVAGSARAALSRETAVDLDAEAADLLRFQQAFQASGRVIQAAAEIFDTILGIR
jgi:flagellar hook-associated protein 1